MRNVCSAPALAQGPTRRHAVAYMIPRFLRRDISRVRDGSQVIWKLCRRKNREEDQRLLMRVVGCVDDAGRDVGHLTRAQDPVLAVDPLLGAPVDDVDDLLAMRVKMKWVTVA